MQRAIRSVHFDFPVVQIMFALLIILVAVWIWFISESKMLLRKIAKRNYDAGSKNSGNGWVKMHVLYQNF